jgi:hypothetical protein
MTRWPVLGARPAIRLGDHSLRDRRGFTLPVVVVSIIVYGLVLLAGIGFVAEASLEGVAGEGPGLRNLRVALAALERDLPSLRVPTPDGETTLVYADEDGIAFFFENGIADGVDDARPADLVTIWFEADPETARPDDYRLLRHVEGYETVVVARRLLRDGSAPFFEYLVSTDPGAASDGPAAVLPPHLLPIGAMPLDDESGTGRVEAQTLVGAGELSRIADQASAWVTPSEATVGFGLRAVRVTLRAEEARADRDVAVRRLIALSSARSDSSGLSDVPR